MFWTKARDAAGIVADARLHDLRRMEAARRAGHRVVLHSVSVDSPGLTLDRIRNRIRRPALDDLGERLEAERAVAHAPLEPVCLHLLH